MMVHPIERSKSTAELVATVLDVMHNELDIAVVVASTEAHTLDHLIYRTFLWINKPDPTGSARL